MWVWGGCCCDFDFVGVLYGVCTCIVTLILIIITFLCSYSPIYIVIKYVLTIF